MGEEGTPASIIYSYKRKRVAHVRKESAPQNDELHEDANQQLSLPDPIFGLTSSEDEVTNDDEVSIIPVESAAPAATVIEEATALNGVDDHDDEPMIVAVEPAPIAPVLPENCFIVERLLQRRKRRGVEEFLVKWQGYSDEHNTWEPRANMFSNRLIEIFEEEEAKQKQMKNAAKKRGQPFKGTVSSVSSSPTWTPATSSARKPSKMSLRNRRPSDSSYLAGFIDDDLDLDSSDDFEVHNLRKPKQPRVTNPRKPKQPRVTNPQKPKQSRVTNPQKPKQPRVTNPQKPKQPRVTNPRKPKKPRMTMPARTRQRAHVCEATTVHTFPSKEPEPLPVSRPNVVITEVALPTGTVTFLETIGSDNDDDSPRKE